MGQNNTNPDQAKETQDNPSQETGSKGLAHRFLYIWIVIVALNVVGSGVLLYLQTTVDSGLMRRLDYRLQRSKSMNLPAWPSTWPAPKHWASFDGPLPFVSSVYAVSWDEDGTKYYLDAVVTHMPAPVCFKRRIRVIDSRNTSGSTKWATQYLIDPAGLLFNSLLGTSTVWVLFCGLPAVAEHSHERELQRQRERELMCLHCQYDIQDLPICPECGNPSHRV